MLLNCQEVEVTDSNELIIGRNERLVVGVQFRVDVVRNYVVVTCALAVLNNVSAGVVSTLGSLQSSLGGCVHYEANLCSIEALVGELSNSRENLLIHVVGCKRDGTGRIKAGERTLVAGESSL